VTTAVHPKPTATQTPQPHIPAKQIASTGANQPRPTWTITPTPSPTPTPTPTVIPTFVNPNYQDAVRPFGVGTNERWVDVNLTTQTLRAYEGDTAVFSTLVSSGTWEHPTVTGQFRIWLSFESQTMDGRLLGYDYYLEDVPYVMYFYQDYALHGTYWHSNFGTPMSHGCVNLATSDAAWIYDFVSIGTLVNVHY
jgi:lipoprotein-anchoring transpeptidase ErfK/SrfK